MAKVICHLINKLTNSSHIQVPSLQLHFQVTFPFFFSLLVPNNSPAPTPDSHPTSANQSPLWIPGPVTDHITHSTKESQPEEDPSVSARLQRLQNNYEDFGMRRTVEGILVVHDHGHPHILMLQIANAFFKLCAILSVYVVWNDIELGTALATT